MKILKIYCSLIIFYFSCQLASLIMPILLFPFGLLFPNIIEYNLTPKIMVGYSLSLILITGTLVSAFNIFRNKKKGLLGFFVFYPLLFIWRIIPMFKFSSLTPTEQMYLVLFLFFDAIALIPFSVIVLVNKTKIRESFR